MKREAKEQCGGFTLVEMLVVVVIIAILVGMVFRLTRTSAQRTAKVQTIARLERLKAAIEEFYADYGQYPPVPLYDGRQPFGYEYAISNGMRSDMVRGWKDYTWSEAPVFTFGLMSFLAKRYEGKAQNAWSELFPLGEKELQWIPYNTDASDENRDDLPRDRKFAEKVAPFLEGICGTYKRERVIRGNKMNAYTNLYFTCLDGWHSDFIYVSKPPYQNYLLFSRGPDGKYDSDNPGDRNSKDNKDNVYGDVGH